MKQKVLYYDMLFSNLFRQYLPIDKMRQAGKIAALILDDIGQYVRPGVSTERIDNICHQLMKKYQVQSSAFGYHGFPKYVCTSVNEVVCHGIPNQDTILQDGDIVNIDVVINCDGYHGDTSRMFFVGNVNADAIKLVKNTYQSMMLGIHAIKPRGKIGDIGYAIQTHAEKAGFSVVREYCGHGIGKNMHESPNIPHWGQLNTDKQLLPGTCITVEPMINAGKMDVVVDPQDQWTVRTLDHSLSAQFEHTIYIHEDTIEILTLSHNGTHVPF